MRSAATIPTGRALGQVFTPPDIAAAMARWVHAHRPRRILDPALGDGAFVESLAPLVRRDRSPADVRLVACELDPAMIAAFRQKSAGLRVRLRHEDFILARFAGRFDAILANPPYVRHHALCYGPAVLARFDRICGLRLSRRTNLYGLFLIRIWTLLADHGRAAVITPADWLNANFGVALKQFLLGQNALDAIVHFDHAAGVFEGVLTTAAVTLLRRGRGADEPVRLAMAAGGDALAACIDAGGRKFPRAALDPRAKWSPLFGDVARSTFRPVDRPATRTLADLAACTRGIATGANGYFTLRESDRRRWGLDRRDLRLCITKSRQAPGPRLTRRDVEHLANADARIYLLCPRSLRSRALRRYLEYGRRLGVDRRYLPAHRPVWYRPERREPAPILVSVFSRGGVRFVLNEAGVLHLTAFHGIYPHDDRPAAVRALFDYLTAVPTRALLQRHCRLYAGGLFKLEPRDVLAFPIPPRLPVTAWRWRPAELPEGRP